jgi:hypothetical protein
VNRDRLDLLSRNLVLGHDCCDCFKADVLDFHCVINTEEKRRSGCAAKREVSAVRTPAGKCSRKRIAAISRWAATIIGILLSGKSAMAAAD